MSVKKCQNLLSIVSTMLFFGMMISCGSNKKSFQGEKLVSVKSFGAKGDGKVDDRVSIQKAFNSAEELYFPDGIYNLKSKSEEFAFLMIENQSFPKRIVFSENAWLKIDANAPNDYFKPAVVCISGRKNKISGICIDGLKIDGNRTNHTMSNPGLLIYSDNYLISNVEISNGIMKNMGGGGYHIEADKVSMKNLKTLNCGNHGIGINGTYNAKGLVYNITIDGYTSQNDEAYGIDFSGPYDTSKPKETLQNFHFKGKVKNVKVINSKYGVKTAGNWDLDIDSMIIDGSEHNGFFLSKDAPFKTIFAKNLTIKNCNGNGLFLAGLCQFVGENIIVENCKVLFQIDNTDIDINGLILDGKHNNIATLRMGTSNVKLENLILKNNQQNDEYPIWVQGKKILLKNGRFENMNGISPIIFKDFESVIIEDLQESSLGTRLPKFQFGATIDSKKGLLSIKNSKFLNLKSIRNIHKLPIKIDF